jgi:hypothetical protein
MFLTRTKLTFWKFEFITVIMVNIKVFWNVKTCLLVNSYLLYQFTRREALEYLKVSDKKKLRGLSPRANYTDRAAAAGRRS